MKILLAVFISFFSLISFTASAQWSWHKKHERLPQIVKPVPSHQPDLLFSTSYNSFNNQLGRSHYSIDAEEASIMKSLRRSTRYGADSLRVQFDKLANFYFSQNRFSEAKWYVLRSNAISRQQKNYPQIIGSLVVLADVKSNLGDFKQADEDLSEAKSIATLHSLELNLLLIEQHTKQIKLNKEMGLKPANHYADFL